MIEGRETGGEEEGGGGGGGGGGRAREREYLSMMLAKCIIKLHTCTLFYTSKVKTPLIKTLNCPKTSIHSIKVHILYY